MASLPDSLGDCLDVVRTLGGQLRTALIEVPTTTAHAEAIALLDQLETMSPQLLTKYEKVQSLFKDARQEIQEKVAIAKDNLDRGRAVRDGQVSKEEVLQMQQKAFGTKFTPPPVPEMPSGWSSVLAQELASNALPKTVAPILPTESNAWNDWQIESNT